MKPILLLGLAIPLSYTINAQPEKSDTNYTSQIVSLDWMPDGKALLLSVVKFHKTDQKAPFFSKSFRYDLSSKQIQPLMENGGNLAPSPDGKMIAFMKRNDDIRADMYLYDIASGRETILKTDTMSKNALSWSPDGTKLLYNTGTYGNVEICTYDFATRQMKQITQSGKDKSYTPVWSPDSRKIVYYLEKGDRHDQIWLTDVNGSFHKNLTNDTSTHNYFPCWLDNKTILYTQSPETIMTMNVDGTNRQKVEGIASFQVMYNPAAAKLAYITEESNDVILYDWKKKKSEVILEGVKKIW